MTFETYIAVITTGICTGVGFTIGSYFAQKHLIEKLVGAIREEKHKEEEKQIKGTGVPDAETS
jgi:hypothetical protein